MEARVGIERIPPSTSHSKSIVYGIADSLTVLELHALSTRIRPYLFESAFGISKRFLLALLLALFEALLRFLAWDRKLGRAQFPLSRKAISRGPLPRSKGANHGYSSAINTKQHKSKTVSIEVMPRAQTGHRFSLVASKCQIRLTSSEWEIMAIVWRFGPITAAEVSRQSRRAKAWSLSTVRTMLRRLVNKGVLAQSKDGKRYLYESLVSSASCASQEIEALRRLLKPNLFFAILRLTRCAKLSTLQVRQLQGLLREKRRVSVAK
jgi:predicted transcriptional regulator